jgi:hypothetical protein
MARWADYSGGHPSGAALAAAGFVGAIRYVGIGGSGKRMTAAEYRDLIANGLQVLLVAEQSTTDAWGGYNAGVANASAALADARALGVPDSVPIFAAADAHATAAQAAAAVDYTRGFRDVLGQGRTGFYGFTETLSAVRNSGFVTYYWRCGSQPSAAEQTWTHFWQRNSSPTQIDVAGVSCDINEQYLAIATDSRPNSATDLNNDEESIVLVPAGTNEHVVVPAAGRPPYLYIFAAFGHTVTIHQMVFVKATNATLPGGDYAPGGTNTDWVFQADRPGPIAVPVGTDGVTLRYTSDHAFTAYIG